MHIPTFDIKALLMSFATLKEMSRLTSVSLEAEINFPKSSPLMLGKLDNPSLINYFLPKNYKPAEVTS